MEAEGKVGKAYLQRVESVLVARLVRQMLDEGLLVPDQDERALRSIEPGDVAVLSCTWAPLEIYGEAFATAHIPVVHAGGGSLLETREAKDGYALLRFLADPTDDLALVAVLRSPFFAIDEPSLHGLALERPNSSSWWVLVREVTSGEPFAHTRGVLRQLLARRRFESPSVLLRFADRLTGYTKNLYWRSYKPLLVRAELPDISFHELRHTCATIRFMRGQHPKRVQELLGHASIVQTMDTYSHVIPHAGDDEDIMGDI